MLFQNSIDPVLFQHSIDADPVLFHYSIDADLGHGASTPPPFPFAPGAGKSRSACPPTEPDRSPPRATARRGPQMSSRLAVVISEQAAESGGCFGVRYHGGVLLLVSRRQRWRLIWLLVGVAILGCRPSEEEILGRWRGTVGEHTHHIEFKREGKIVIDGAVGAWKYDGGVVHIDYVEFPATPGSGRPESEESEAFMILELQDGRLRWRKASTGQVQTLERVPAGCGGS